MSSTKFFFYFIPLLSFILLLVNFILAPHMPYKEKKTPFECGYHSFLAQNRTQFTISFFIFALLFLLFDIEIVSVYPLTVSSYFNNIYGLCVVIVFVLILTLGFVFELGKGALNIETKQTKNPDGAVSNVKLSTFVPSLYVVYTFLKKCYNSLEWNLTSPPKPHAFVSLPLSSELSFKSVLHQAKAAFVIFYAKMTFRWLLCILTCSMVTKAIIFTSQYFLTCYNLVSLEQIQVALAVAIVSMYAQKIHDKSNENNVIINVLLLVFTLMFLCVIWYFLSLLLYGSFVYGIPLLSSCLAYLDLESMLKMNSGGPSNCEGPIYNSFGPNGYPNGGGPTPPNDGLAAWATKTEYEHSDSGSESERVGSDFSDPSVNLNLFRITREELPHDLANNVPFMQAAYIHGWGGGPVSFYHYLNNSDVHYFRNPLSVIMENMSTAHDYYVIVHAPDPANYNHQDTWYYLTEKQILKVRQNTWGYAQTMYGYIDRSDLTPMWKGYFKMRVDLCRDTSEKHFFTVIKNHYVNNEPNMNPRAKEGIVEAFDKVRYTKQIRW